MRFGVDGSHERTSAAVLRCHHRFLTTSAWQAIGQSVKGQQTILYGAAYYEEYAPPTVWTKT